MLRFLALAALLLAACGSDDGTASGATDLVQQGGAGTTTPPAGKDGPRVPPPALGQPEKGIATYYASANGAGNCTFDASPSDLDVAAMNAVEYAGSAACGACVKATGPKGDVTVRIVDQCADCEKGHLDFSKSAFAKIADVSAGRVDIEWAVVACDVSGPVQYHFKDGSSEYWTAIQIRNHRLPIAKLELKKSGGSDWAQLKREEYNYFIAAGGVGNGSFGVRITSETGVTLEDTFDRVTANASIDGAKQFP